MDTPLDAAFVIRTFRISADGDKKLKSASLALRTPKSRLIEEGITLVVAKRMEQIREGARHIQENFEASLTT